MRFTLSNETRHAVEKSTGREYSELVKQPMHGLNGGDLATEKRHETRNCRIIPPRGSVYLQMGRVTPLDVVKRMIFNFK